MSKDDKKRPEDDVKSRRELLTATAKLSAFIGAVGLTGVGVSEAASATTLMRPPMHTVRPRASRRLLPAVQKREFQSLMRDAMRTGNSRAALKRTKLKLSPAQQKILIGLTPKDWAVLRSYESRLRGLKAPGVADDTGIIIY